MPVPQKIACHIHAKISLSWYTFEFFIMINSIGTVKSEAFAGNAKIFTFLGLKLQFVLIRPGAYGIQVCVKGSTVGYRSNTFVAF